MDFIHKVADYFTPHPHEQEHHIFDPDELDSFGGGHSGTASAPAAMGQAEASEGNPGGGRPARNRKKVEPYVASFVLKAKPLREVQGRKRNNEKENNMDAGGEDDNALVSSQGSEMSLASSQGSVIDPSTILGVPMSLASFNLSVTLKPEDDPEAKGTTFVVGASGPQTRKRSKAVDRGHDVPSQGLLPVTERSEMGTDVPGPSLELMGRDYFDDYNLDTVSRPCYPNDVPENPEEAVEMTNVANDDTDERGQFVYPQGAEEGMDTGSQRTTRRGRKRSNSPHVRIEDVADHKEEEKAASPQKGGRGRKKSATPQPAERQQQEPETPEKGRSRKSASTPPSSMKRLTETPKSAGPQKYGRGRKSKLEDTAEPPQVFDETPKGRGRKGSATPTPAPTPESSLETIFDESMLTPEAEPGTPRGRKKTPTPNPQNSQQEVDQAPMATRGSKAPQASQDKPITEPPKPTAATARGRKKSASPKPAEEQPQAKQRKTSRGQDEDQESTKTDGSDRFFPAREDLPPAVRPVPLDEMAKREMQKQQAPKSRGRQPPSGGKQAPKPKATEDLISSGGRGGKRSTFRKKPQRKSEKAGTVFPVGRIHRLFREHESNRMRVGVGAAVYAAAAVEYLVAEVLEISGMVAKGEKKRRINPHHINRCIKGDTELDQLFGSAIIPEGGHEPYIHPALLPKKPIGKKEQHAVGA